MFIEKLIMKFEALSSIEQLFKIIMFINIINTRQLNFSWYQINFAVAI